MYIYTLIRSAHISPQIKNKLKGALLAAAFLLSFFSLSGYVRSPQQTGRAVTSEQVLVASRGNQRYAYYKQQFSSAYADRRVAALIAKQNKIASVLFTQAACAGYQQSCSGFMLVKATIAYPIMHQIFSADLR
jgi:hypothetical protein